MEYIVDKKEVILNKKLNNLDRFVLDFVSYLDSYVIVSGYVSILFGRSRATEDVDLLVPKLGDDDFYNIWEKLHKNGFWCINTRIFKDALTPQKEQRLETQILILYLLYDTT